MEELADAIEDAQYVNAISTQEDGPRPVLAWEIPTEEQLSEWKEKVSERPGAFELEWILESAIGLFQFSAFLKDVCNDYLRINFLEEILRWRKKRGRDKVEKAKRIITNYLKGTKHDPNTGAPLYPPKTQIEEYDLERPNKHTPSLDQLIQENHDPTNTKCCIGLDGPVRDKIFTIIHKVEQARAAYRKEKEQQRAASTKNNPELTVSQATEETTATYTSVNNEDCSTDLPNSDHDGYEEEEPPHTENTNPAAATATNEDQNATDAVVTKSSSAVGSSRLLLQRRKSEGPRYLPDDFFDDAEAIVIDALKNQYQEAFKQSEQYHKLLNFLWYQDRSVTPEDFFVMRVLGRGGFGLVTGTF